MSFKIQTTIELSEKQIKDVLVGAFEGGSNYWYFLGEDSVKAIRDKVSKEENPYLSEAITEAVFKGAEVPIYDIEDEKTLLGTLSKEGIEKGLVKMMEDGREEIYDVLHENDDAGTSDVMLQYFLMGTIVFG